jgi:hypothetical protein
MSLPMKMSAELLAIMMVGDGMLALTQPRRHMRLWNAGPTPYRKLATFFEGRPGLTMAVGAGLVVLGLWLASGQDREEDDVYDALGEEAHVPAGAWQDLSAIH